MRKLRSISMKININCIYKTSIISIFIKKNKSVKRNACKCELKCQNTIAVKKHVVKSFVEADLTL